MATHVDLVAIYLMQHTGYHRPRDVAQAVGIRPHQAAVALRYMFEKGQIDRQRITHAGHRHPTGYYSAFDGEVRPPARQPWARAAGVTTEEKAV